MVPIRVPPGQLCQQRASRLFRHGSPTAIAGFLLLGLFGEAGSQAREAPTTPAFHDWGKNSRDALGWDRPTSYYNAVQVTRLTRRPDSPRAPSFQYWTGGWAETVDSDALAAARLRRPPDRLLAKHQEGQVLVRLWGDSQAAEGADVIVLQTAMAAHMATTRIWPRESLPIQVDIHLMPEGAAYSLAREVRWKSGRPLELAIFLPGISTPEDQRTKTAMHELYHLLAALMGVGRWTTDETTRANAFIAFEEVAATSFASCGHLLAVGYLPRPQKDTTVVVNDVPIKAPLSADEVKRLLRVLRYVDANSLSDLGTRIGGVLDTAAVFHVLGAAQQRIELNSPQGEQLLTLCQEFSPDPLKVEQWLETLAQEQTGPHPSDGTEDDHEARVW